MLRLSAVRAPIPEDADRRPGSAHAAHPGDEMRKAMDDGFERFGEIVEDFGNWLSASASSNG